MATFKNPRQLELHLNKVIDDIIRHEVKDTIVEIWLEVQKERVYKTYDPIQYDRRLEDGGLADPDNIVFADFQKFKGGLSYVLENITEGAGDVIGEKINALIEGQADFAGDPATGMPARPYTEEAVSLIKSHPTAMKTALSQGFARHGIKTTIR